MHYKTMKLNLKHLRPHPLCIATKPSAIIEVPSLASYRKQFQFSRILKQVLIIHMVIRGKVLQDRKRWGRHQTLNLINCICSILKYKFQISDLFLELRKFLMIKKNKNINFDVAFSLILKRKYWNLIIRFNLFIINTLELIHLSILPQVGYFLHS